MNSNLQTLIDYLSNNPIPEWDMNSYWPEKVYPRIWPEIFKVERSGFVGFVDDAKNPLFIDDLNEFFGVTPEDYAVVFIYDENPALVEFQNSTQEQFVAALKLLLPTSRPYNPTQIE